MLSLLLVEVAPSTFERLGTAGIVALILSAVIGWLLRDRIRLQAHHDATVAALIASRDSERARADELHERLLEQATKLIPVAENLGAITESVEATLLRIQYDEGRR